MPLKIIRKEEPLTVQNISIAIYGQPGAGKTSLACTAKNPLTLDLDRGIHRSAFRGDAVQIESWSDIAKLTEADLEGYDTIIVDTVGRALDALSAQLIADDEKLARRTGELTLQGYGALKASFINWLKRLKSMRKDVILVAHDAEDKQGDDLIVRPDVQGGSRQEIIKATDAIGYLYRANKQTILDFNPTDRWIAKNPAGVEPLAVPDFAQVPDFLAQTIHAIKSDINRMTEEQRESADFMADWQAKVDDANDADDLNRLVGEISKSEHPSAANVKRMIMTRARNLKIEFDREQGCFIQPEGQASEPAGEEQADNEAADAGQGRKKKAAKKKAAKKKTAKKG